MQSRQAADKYISANEYSFSNVKRRKERAESLFLIIALHSRASDCLLCLQKNLQAEQISGIPSENLREKVFSAGGRKILLSVHLASHFILFLISCKIVFLRNLQLAIQSKKRMLQLSSEQTPDAHSYIYWRSKIGGKNGVYWTDDRCLIKIMVALGGSWCDGFFRNSGSS